MPSARSAGRAKTQKASEERLKRQQDRNAQRMPVPPRPTSSPVEADMLSLFGSIMHGVHCASSQLPAAPRPQPTGQWLLTEALHQSPNGLRPENIVALHDNNTDDNGLDTIPLPNISIDGVAVDPMVVFFVGLVSKAEKAVAEVEGKRGSPMDHLRAYLKAFKRDFHSYAGPKMVEAERSSRVHTPHRAADTSISAGLPNTRSTTEATALPTTSSIICNNQSAADIAPPSIRPRSIQLQRKGSQLKGKRSLTVRLKVPAFLGDSSSRITTAVAQPNLASSNLIRGSPLTTPISSGLTHAGQPKPQKSTSATQSASGTVATSNKRKAAEEPTVNKSPASKKTRTTQKSGRKAPVTLPPQLQASTRPYQESNTNTHKARQLRSTLNMATQYAESESSRNDSQNSSLSNKRKSPMDGDIGNGIVSEQPAKRRHATTPQSKAPHSAVVKRTTKTAKTTPAAAAAAAPSASSADPTPAPTPAPTTKPAALPPRQRNGAGPVTGRDGFELIGSEPRFKLGQNDEALLTLRFYRNDEAGNRVVDSYTWRGKTDNRTPADIDWNNPKDIKILNKWMLQYLSRTWKCNGLRPDMMSRVWMDEEFEWLAEQARHYHSWSKEDIPNQREKMEEFNEEWEGEQIPFLNMEGEEVVTQPRPERTVAAIASAMRRDEETHPERWVGTHLEGRSKVKREGAKGKEEEEEEEEL